MGALDLPFPQAGEGVVIRFRAQDLAKIQEKLGAQWFAAVYAGLDKFDVDILELLVNVGAKKAGESTFKLKMVDLEHVTLFDLAMLMIDALSLRVHGERAADAQRTLAVRRAAFAK